MLLACTRMQLLLFRHAERANSGTADPTLSSRGLAQAEALGERLTQKILPAPTRMLVSPKTRSRQTFEPAAAKLRLELQMMPELNERQKSETAPQFTERVRRFLAFLERQNGILYACTHLDWIEEALLAIPSNEDLLAEKHQAWVPAQFLEFDLQEGLWFVVNSGRISI